MNSRQRNEPFYDRVILLMLFALFLLFSPFTEWWAADDSPWYAPYLIWALLIGLGYALRHQIDRHTVKTETSDD